jgi:hypothetical protein
VSHRYLGHVRRACTIVKQKKAEKEGKRADEKAVY